MGARRPTPATPSEDAATVWTRLTVAQWYGRQVRDVEIVSETALWYSTGLPPVPIRWVLVRDPAGKFPTQALPCTDLMASPDQILAWFVQRWQLEVTFHAMRAHLGMETQRQWSAPAIARTTPALFGLFSLVTLLAHPELSRTPTLPLPDGVVPQLAANVCGRNRPSTPPRMGVAAFSDFRLDSRSGVNPGRPPRPFMQPALLRGLNG